MSLMRLLIGQSKRQPDLGTMHVDAVSIIHLGPGDVLAVRFDRSLTGEEAHQVHEWVKRLIPGNEVLVLDKGTELGVIWPPEKGS